MNKTFKNIAATCLVCMVVVAVPLLSSCKKQEEKPVRNAHVKSPAIIEEGTLKVGVNLGFAPYAVKQDGSFVGLDVDVAEYLSEKLGLYPEFVAINPDEIPSALRENKIDVALSAPMDTPKVNVYGPYSEGGIALYVGDQSDVAMQDVAGLYPIGVQKNSVGYWALMNEVGAQDISTFKTDKELIFNLESGEVQIGALDSIVASYAIAGGAKIKKIDYIEGKRALGVAVSTKKTELSLAIEDIMKSDQSTSVFDSFVRKWLAAGQQTDAKE